MVIYRNIDGREGVVGRGVRRWEGGILRRERRIRCC
jgi:hypothetical protein